MPNGQIAHGYEALWSYNSDIEFLNSSSHQAIRPHMVGRGNKYIRGLDS